MHRWLASASPTAKRLVSQLRDPSHNSEAARELVRLGPEAVPALMDALASTDPDLPSLSAQVLARIGAPALPALTRALQTAHPLVRLQAAQALGWIKDSSALPVLLSALHGEFFTVRAAAATALASIGDSRALEALLAAMQDPEPSVRSAAVLAVASFNLPATFETLAPLLLDDPKIEVRQAAARALGATRHPSALPLLIEALHDSFWWYERESTAADLLDAIQNMGEPAIPLLVDALTDPERAVRRFAASLLGRLHAASAVEPLGMALYDMHHEVGNAAALALASIGPASLVVLEAAAHHPEPAIRQNVALALGAMETSHSTDLLLELLQDPERSVQSQVIESLTRQQDPRAITALLQLSRDRSDRRLQSLAQTALRKLNLTP